MSPVREEKLQRPRFSSQRWLVSPQGVGGEETDDSKRKEIYDTQDTEVDKAEGSGEEW